MESGGTRPTEPDPGPQSPAPGPQSPAPGPQSPAPPPQATQEPPGGWAQPIPPGALKFASWWSRVGAAIIDGLVILVPTIVITAAFGFGAAASDDGIGGFLAGIALTWLVAIVIGIFYAPLLMARDGVRNGQTWGKQAAGIRVVKADGAKIDFGFAALRELAVKGLLINGVGSFFLSIPTLVNYLWPLWDDQNRALHDMIVNTRVVES